MRKKKSSQCGFNEKFNCRKKTPKLHISIVFTLLSFLFVFEKTEGFFQINKFSCLAMIKKKIPTHLQAN